MPYPAQIDRDSIVNAARTLIETQGIGSLTLRAVASSLGVQAPSLYRHVKNKDAIVRAVNEVTNHELNDVTMNAAGIAASVVERLVGAAHAYRSYAREHPACYVLATSSAPNLQPDEDARLQTALPLQALVAELTGDAASLPALRGAYALLHGWLSLEINNQLRRGGDLGAHFEQSFRAYLAGWRL